MSSPLMSVTERHEIDTIGDLTFQGSPQTLINVEAPQQHSLFFVFCFFKKEN